MTKPIRITDIDAFKCAGLVPEDAVTTMIVENVRKLDERSQLEPWVQHLLGVTDDTAHGPMEIADCISSRITVNGEPRLAALILKGRSAPKPTSRQVGHQVLRLLSFPEIQLVCLLAVGDIQDDLKRDMITVAAQFGADYLVASGMDIARLLIASNYICADDGSAFEGGRCSQGHAQTAEIALHYRVREDLKADLVQLRDVSHGMARRLAAHVLVDPHYSQESLLEAIKATVSATRTDPYVRSELVRMRWRDSPAHVVYVFVGHDLHDVTSSNWSVRACWIDPELDHRFRPTWDSNAVVIDGIQVVFNPDYHGLRQIFEQHKAGKAQVLSHIVPLIERLRVAFAKIVESGVTPSELNVGRSVVTQCLDRLSGEREAITRAASETPVPPFECRDVVQRFQEAVALFDNLCLAYDVNGPVPRTPVNRASLFSQNLRDLERTLHELEYERRKVGSG